MGIFDALKKAVFDISKEYGRDDRFLLSVCAAAALVANADGVIEDSERAAAIKLVRDHKTLGQLYSAEKIETAISHALTQVKTQTGKQELIRDLEAIKGMDNGVKAAEDVYAVATDIAAADGSVGDDEKVVMERIAKRLGVDVSKFDL